MRHQHGHGSFVFPAQDKGLMQMLEVRGNNGGTETVETVYVLAGTHSYAVPERLFAFDDPDLYKTAEPTRVNMDYHAVAQTVADFYEPGPGPTLIAHFHTHPSGNGRPSDQDHSVAESRETTYDRYFDDYQLFLGIHGLGEECDPDPEWMRRPQRTATNEVSWWGENRKHTLSLYDGAYEPRPVAVLTADQARQQIGQQQGRVQEGGR
jgi:proteasome lid subunit RPN8/RPN11